MLAIAALTSLSAFAQDWTIPAPKSSPIADRDTFYLRNVGTGKYFTKGEAWTTQAVVGTEGALMVRPELQADGTYAIQDNATGWATNYIWRQPNDGTLGTGVKGCFSDNGNTRKERFWAIAEVGANVYTIQIPSTFTEEAEALRYVEGEFLGVQSDHASTWAANNAEGVTWGLYYDVVYADHTANCQWEFIGKPAMGIYNAKVALLALARSAQEQGVDVSTTSAQSVIEDENATLEQIDAATTELNDAIRNLATPEDPKDMTGLIKNASPYANASYWTVTNKEGQPASPNAFDPANQCAEFWNLSGYSMKQTIKDLPAGVYKLTVLAFTRTNMQGKLYAGTDTVNLVQVGSDVVNNRAGAKTYFNEGNGVNIVGFAVPETQDITIGLTADTLTGDHWTVWRSFKLEYTGNSPAAYHQLFDNFDLDSYQVSDEMKFKESYKETLAQRIEAGLASTDPTTIYNLYKQAREDRAALDQNIAAYKKLDIQFKKSSEALYQQGIYTDDFQDIMDEAEAALEAMNLTTEEATAMTAAIAQAEADARLSTYNEGDDISALIHNHTFSADYEPVGNDVVSPQSGFNAWHMTIGGKEVTQPTNAAYGEWGNGNWCIGSNVAEFWSANFDMYQDVSGLKEGVYALSTEGFYRTAGQFNAWTAAAGQNTGANEVKAVLYANDGTTLFPNIYLADGQRRTEAVGEHSSDWTALSDNTYVPNTRAAANDEFTAGNLYLMTTKGIVIKEEGKATGTLRVGIRVAGGDKTNWTIWDDMKLVYLGKDASVLAEALEEELAKAEALNDSPMAAAEKSALLAAESNGRDKLASTNGDEILAAYKDLVNAEKDAKVSIDAYAGLATVQDSLSTLLPVSQAAASVKADAQDCLDRVESALANGDVTTADAAALVAEGRSYYKPLQVVGDPANASDDNAVDYTAYIVNPTYITSSPTAQTTDVKGWTITGSNANVAYNVAEGWNANFDIKQTITGLPEGTYKLTVKGFYRNGELRENTERLMGDSLRHNSVFYANGEEVEPANIAMMYQTNTPEGTGRWASPSYRVVDPATGEVMQNKAGTGDSIFVIKDQYAPDSQQAAQSVFYNITNDPITENPGVGETTIYCYVDESGTLTIGAKRENTKPGDWLMLSAWHLYYLGTESEHESATGINDLNNANVVSRSIYTIDGRQVNTLQKGLNIVKMTTADGKTVSKKVMVK